MQFTTNNNIITITLHDILYVPDIKKNLFFIQNAIKQGLVLKFKNNSAVFYDKNRPILTAILNGNLYYINNSVIYLQQANISY